MTDRAIAMGYRSRPPPTPARGGEVAHTRGLQPGAMRLTSTTPSFAAGVVSGPTQSDRRPPSPHTSYRASASAALGGGAALVCLRIASARWPSAELGLREGGGQQRREGRGDGDDSTHPTGECGGRVATFHPTGGYGHSRRAKLRGLYFLCYKLRNYQIDFIDFLQEYSHSTPHSVWEDTRIFPQYTSLGVGRGQKSVST